MASREDLLFDGTSNPRYNPVNETYWTYDGARHPLFQQPGRPLDGLAPTGTSPAPVPPHLRYSFDTIGQVIFRTIGHCRVPLRTIWAKGRTESGDAEISNTQTFAAALCAPIDPLEEGEIFALWHGGSQVFNSSGPVTPDGWTAADAALLATSVAGVVIYPGDEAQLPASLIVADKGAAKTNAFRGIRYLIFPDYPIAGGGNTGGIPQISLGWLRTNDGGSPRESDGDAVEFLGGSS